MCIPCSHRFLDKLPVVHWHLLTDKSIDPTYLVVMTATAAVGAASLLQRVIQIRTKPTPPNPRRPSSVQAFHSSTSCAGLQSRAVRKAVAQSAVHRFSTFKLLKRFSRVSAKNWQLPEGSRQMVPVWLEILNSDHWPESSRRKLSRKMRQARLVKKERRGWLLVAIHLRAFSAVRVCCWSL